MKDEAEKMGYEERQARWDREYARAFEELPEGLREEMKRAGIDGPDLGGCVTLKPDFDGVIAQVPFFDVRGEREEDEVAEEFGVSLELARALLAWRERAVAAELAKENGSRLNTAIGLLLQPSKNLVVKVWGLAFSRGFASRISGANSMAERAKLLGCHRALLSHYKQMWDRVLGESATMYGKRAETRVKLRDARLRVIARNPNKEKSYE